jgi:hypothetical protein
MAMHKPKKTKRFQPGGLVDSEGRPVRDGSGQSIMTGFGREEAETQKRMQAAEAKLAQDVQDKLKVDKAAKDDADFAEADRMSSTARSVAGKPASNAAPSAKAKSGIVTKEELAKSGLSLRDYMNKQRGLTRRDGAAPAKAPSKATTPAVSSSYRSEGANKAKPTASSGNVSSAAEKPKTAATSAVASKQREADEKRREERREFGRQRDAKEKAEKEKFTKDLSNDPGQIAIRKEREAAKSISPSERSAARGKAVKEFFGINTKKPLDAKGATIQSMDTDMMRAAGRAAAKEQGQKRKVESTYKKGGSVSSASKRADGCAVRGKTKCKVY